MRGFMWNGRTTDEMSVGVSEIITHSIPAERAQFITVPGRSGALVIREGEGVLDDVIRTAECYIKNLGDFTSVSAWFRGMGNLYIGARPGGYYRAVITNQIDFEKIARGHPGRAFTVVFRCDPYWHSDTGDVYIQAINGGNIAAPNGVEASPPIIEVTGTGSGILTVNGAAMSIDNIGGVMHIDAERRICYANNVIATGRCQLIEDAWPCMKPGQNMVSWSGGITAVRIKPRWRFI